MKIKQTLLHATLGLMLVVGFGLTFTQPVEAKEYKTRASCEKKGGIWSGSANPTRDDAGGCLFKNNKLYNSESKCSDDGGEWDASTKGCYFGNAVSTSSGPAAPATCAGVGTSIISCGGTRNSTDLQSNGIWLILLIALQILAGGVGMVAVGGIVYASIMYASAQDNDAQVKKAKDTIANVIIGIVAFALMYSVLQFLIPGGIFN